MLVCDSAMSSDSATHYMSSDSASDSMSQLLVRVGEDLLHTDI